MNNDVKILYCYDENKNVIHYRKAEKGNKYFCIDCAAELICKHGEVYQKHLAHKNTLHCGGTGESIIHKHWKSNLFVPGMSINISHNHYTNEEVEILEVLNNVSLSKHYNMEWDREIRSDVILITSEGDIIVEINYKGKSKFNKLADYYNTLDVLKVYEVTVPKSVNSNFKWYSLDEYNKEQEAKRREQERLAEEQRRREMLYKTQSQLRSMNESDLFYSDSLHEAYEMGLYQDEEVEVMINFKNKLVGYDENNFRLIGMYGTHNNYSEIKLNFNIELLNVDKEELQSQLSVEKGIIIVKVSIFDTIHHGYNQVLDLDSVEPFRQTDKRLYAQLCNLSEHQA
ncbi:competence protein CoiA family protein [Niallia alba]|uniref:competence protein CoiA family protein n=1 Tax=Niallia alba TaxID=2729105 RepID=UPI002E1F4C99|nr:competence protein CoiA family protein [Niallia alba]